MNQVSIIIPMYNEKRRIGKTIKKVEEYLKFYPFDEVIFVDDGSNDGTVYKVLKSCKGVKSMRLVCLLPNQGKWAAIRSGYFAARKKYVAILDADLSVDLDFVNNNRWMLSSKKLIIGDRYDIAGADVPLRRFVVSRIFNLFVRVLVGIRHSDTQAPAKLMPKNRKFNKIFSELKETRFAGDVELIYRAGEFMSTPVYYSFVEGSSVNVVKHGIEMLKALWRIRCIK